MNTQPYGGTDQRIDLACEYLSVLHIWLFVIIMSRTHFRVNPHSIFSWMWSNYFLETGAISEVLVTPTGLEPTTIYFVNEHSTIWLNWPNNWAELWVLICPVYLTISFYHVTYAFQSESTLYISLNVNKIIVQNKRNICRLSQCNGTPTHNHLLRKGTLNHLSKLTEWLSCVVSTYLYRAFDPMFLPC